MIDERNDRLEELLIQQATTGLDKREARELRELIEKGGAQDQTSYEKAAAMIDLAISEEEPCPPDLKERLLRDAGLYFRSSHEKALDEPVGERADRLRWQPWLAIAASLILFVLGWWLGTGFESVQSGRSTAEERERLLTGPDQLVQLAWQSPNPLGNEIRGDVVWSETSQIGYMRFEGLPINDPNVKQYQLWIFDGRRDDRYPVDGGVFDISDSGEAVVPIRAKLRVFEPKLFAVTIEQPGGVVVSGREQVAALASVP